MRRRVERIGLLVMACLGILVVPADALGWLDRLSPGGAIPKLTLLVVCTVTIVLLFEVERLQALDDVQKQLAKLDIDRIAEELKKDHYAGLTKVHPEFATDAFIRYIETARQVTILNTWIPNLELLEEALAAAVQRRAEVRILVLNPRSTIAPLRDESLGAPTMNNLDHSVRNGVAQNIDLLDRQILARVDGRRRGCLKVKYYDSLPSISVYRADEHYFVGMYFHGGLAIHSPQLEISGADTILGKKVQRELDILWAKGQDVRLGNGGGAWVSWMRSKTT